MCVSCRGLVISDFGVSNDANYLESRILNPIPNPNPALTAGSTETTPLCALGADSPPPHSRPADSASLFLFLFFLFSGDRVETTSSTWFSVRWS